MISYFIKSMVIAALLLAFYGLFLLPEKMNRFKRWFLLLALVASLIIPALALQLHILPAATMPVNFPSVNHALNNIVSFHSTPLSQSGPAVSSVNAKETAQPGQPSLLLYSFCLVSLLLLIRNIWQIFRFHWQIRQHPVQKKQGIQLILLDQGEVSFSFLRYICIAPPDMDSLTGHPLKDIYQHELTHARQLHSLDILFVCFLQALCWWNPFIILFKRAIRLNHEFLADEEVLATNTPFSSYQHLLLSRIQIKQAHALASTSIYSLTKKRFQMMTKHSSNRKIRLLQAASACLVGGCLLILSQQTLAQDKASQAAATNPKIIAAKTLNPATQTGISQAQFDYYQKQVAEHLVIKDKSENWRWKDSELNQIPELRKLYQKMSPEQKKSTREFPLPPPPPPPPYSRKKSHKAARPAKPAPPAPPVAAPAVAPANPMAPAAPKVKAPPKVNPPVPPAKPMVD